MKASREVVTLSDGTRVVLRALNQIDAWTISEIDDRSVRIATAIARAVISPRIEIEGQPLEEPTPGTIHILDLPDEDFSLLMNRTNLFALGGARRAQFSPDDEGSGDAARA